MHKRARWFSIIGGVWIILVCGCGYLSLIRPGIGTRWRQETAPPEQVSLLKLGNLGEIIAETSQGNLYEFNYSSISSWEKVTAPTGSPAIGMNCLPGDGSYLVLPPPGKVKSRVNENCVYIESGYHLEVVLLENGEIWSWENERYAYTELFLMCFLFIAFVLGAPLLLLGLGMKIHQTLNRNRVAQRSNPL